MTVERTSAASRPSIGRASIRSGSSATKLLAK